LEVWDTKDEKCTLFLAQLASDTVCFHPRLPQILAALPNGQIGIWDVQCAKQIAHFTVARSPDILAFSADGERFAASYIGNTNEVSIYNSGDGAVLGTHMLREPASALEWHPRGHWLACGDDSGSIRLINPDAGVAQILGRHKMEAVLTTFSPDGRYLISGGWERECICWDLKRMERAFTLPLGSFRAQFSSDGHQCAIITDEKIQFYTFESPVACHEFEEDLGSRLKEAAFSADGRWLAAAASERIGVWEVAQKCPVALLEEPGGAGVFFSDKGELFASSKREALRWRMVGSSNATARPEPAPIRTPPGFVSLCIASNQVILTTSRGSAVMLQDETDPGELHWTPTAIGTSGASPDNRWVGIFAPFDYRLRIYELPTLQRVATLAGTNKISSFQFSPDSHYVAVNSPHNVEIWSTEDWRRIHVLSNFVALLYVPGGDSCWLTKDYRSAGLYDLRTLEPLLPLPPGILPIAVSHDGRYLAASLNAHYLQLWDLAAVKKQLAALGLDWIGQH
jgi:WD40 repeat protein